MITLPPSDAIVVGAGPNGLSAAIELARHGLAVTVVEQAATVGGGTRSDALTLPGFAHDVCSAIHPLGIGSPFLRALPLARYGLEWIHPDAPLAHPLDDAPAVVLERSAEATAAHLGPDGGAYERMMAPLAARWAALERDVLAPPHWPHHPAPLAAFGLRAARSAGGLLGSRFRHPPARALFAGMAAHSCLPLERPGSAAFGLVLGLLGHAFGWPLPRGGAQRIADALAGHLRDLGGRIVVGTRVESLGDLPPARAVLLDLAPRQLLRLAGRRLPRAIRAMLGRYRYGPGAFKIDWALDGPIPWRDPACGRAGTVHVGGTFEQIAAAEREVARGRHPQRPFVLLAQPTLFDPTRAPPGRHVGWAYCHVPNGSDVDMTERIERQVERFAPGFRGRILARHTRTAAELARENPACVGGDINGGAQDLRQLFTRPLPRWRPYRTGIPGVYLCSAATPPGGGVHGLCGAWAACTALDDLARGRTAAHPPP